MSGERDGDGQSHLASASRDVHPATADIAGQKAELQPLRTFRGGGSRRIALRLDCLQSRMLTSGRQWLVLPGGDFLSMMDQHKQRICITGMSGLVGSLVAAHLEPRYALRGFNRRSLPGMDSVCGDVADLPALCNAFSGCAVVIHLAGYVFADNNWNQILRDNIVGIYNVLEAMRTTGVKRLLFASSMSVLGGHVPEFESLYRYRALYTQQEKVGFFAARDCPRPDSIYGASKAWGEAMCRLYLDRFQIGAVCLRLGEVHRDDKPDRRQPLSYARWCSHPDLFAAVDLALEMTQKPCFAILHVLSSDRPGTDTSCNP